MSEQTDQSSHYEEGSLSLWGTVMLGTGVMIGAGIFALTGQIVENNKLISQIPIALS